MPHKSPLLGGVKMQKGQQLARKPSSKASKFHPFMIFSPIMVIKKRKEEENTYSECKLNEKDHSKETSFSIRSIPA